MRSMWQKNFGAAFLLVLMANLSLAANILNANSATAAELAAVPQLNNSLVNAIIDGRPYASIRALDVLLGESLDEEQRESIYGHIFVPISLNNATNADIQLIPGVGRRMAHEFEEYRPYSNIEQFRREIGKYVDEDEVARLEKYVTLD